MYTFLFRGALVMHPESAEERVALTVLFQNAKKERHPEFLAEYESGDDSLLETAPDGMSEEPFRGAAVAASDAVPR